MKRPMVVPGRPILNRRARSLRRHKRSSPQRQDAIAGRLSSSDNTILMGLAQGAFSATMRQLQSEGLIHGDRPILISYPSRTIDLLAQACVNFSSMPAAARGRRGPEVVALAEALAAIKAGTPSVDDGLLGELVFDSLAVVDYINAWGF